VAKFTISTIFRALDQFSGPVSKMSKNALKFSRTADASFASMGNTMRSLRNIVVGIGAALTTGYIAKGITEFASKGHEIAETARILGMSSTAFQELAYAAKMLGVEEEKLVGPMQKMNNSLGELKTKQGSLYTHLMRTNPRLAAQLRSVTDSSEAFMLLVDAIGKETDASRKASLAQAAFGKAGQEIILLAAAGGEEIARLRKEAYKYGAILDEKAIEGSERFVDSLKRAKDALRGVANIILGKTVLALQPLIQRFAEWVAANREMIAQKISAVFQGIGKAVSIVVRLWKSGLIPAILAGVLAFKAITLAVQLCTAAQALFNAAMAANPIGLIIVAVAVLVALIVLAVKNWDKITVAVSRAWSVISEFATGLWTRVVSAFQAVGKAISDLLNNPLILAAGLIFAPFITVPLLIAKHWNDLTGAFRAVRDAIAAAFGSPIIAAIASILDPFVTLPLLIARNWEKLEAIIGNIIARISSAVRPVIDAVKSIGDVTSRIFGGGPARARPDRGAADAAPSAALSPNAGVIEGMGELRRLESNSTLDVNFNNLPAGTAMRQRGKAPGITVRTGMTFAKVFP